MPDKPNQPSRRSQRESDSGAAGAGGPGGGEPAQPEQPGAAQPSGAEMAQPADAGPVQPGNAGPVQPANVGPVQPANAGPTQPTGDLEVQSAPVRPYMIGRKSGPLPADVIPVDLNLLEAKFKEEQIPGARLKKTVTRPGALGLFDLGGGPSDKIIVAEMPEAHAKALAQSPDLIVEEDRPIQLPQTPVSAPAPPQTRRDPGLVFPQGLGFTVTISVVGTDGAKIPGAEVHVFGVWDHPGITDANGQIQLPLYGETGNSITALYVKPHADYWDILISQPPLDSARNNIVAVAPLSTSFPNFPNQEVTGWGLKAMKIDQLPASFRGRGIKVGLVDSGIALNHRDLQQLVKSGYDTTQTDNPNGWSNDEIGHGTHCAGVIAGRINQLGIRGIAPDVDLYVYKIFPGGSFSNLIDALNHCLADGVDIVNLSLGSDQPSQLVEQKLTECRDAGIVCVVAAGNTGNAVQYPASSPNVLAVAAMGKQDEFPPNSYHATQVFRQNGTTTTPDGFFSAKFTCFGPQVAVAGPGVSILSSVPPDNWASWDGTSMAAPHITGLGALILAHHQDFQGSFAARNRQRVDRFVQIVRASCQALNFGDPNRTGAGLPDATRAIPVPMTAGPGGVSPTTPMPDLSEVQRLLAALLAAAQGGAGGGATTPASVTPQSVGVTPQSVGVTPTTPTNPDLQALQTATVQAGLGGGVSAQMVGVSPCGPNETALNQLADDARKAGLSGTAGSPTPQAVSAAPSGTEADINKLTSAAQDAGLGTAGVTTAQATPGSPGLPPGPLQKLQSAAAAAGLGPGGGQAAPAGR